VIGPVSPRPIAIDPASTMGTVLSIDLATRCIERRSVSSSGRRRPNALAVGASSETGRGGKALSFMR
jgi:hypothetical protein